MSALKRQLLEIVSDLESATLDATPPHVEDTMRDAAYKLRDIALALPDQNRQSCASQIEGGGSGRPYD